MSQALRFALVGAGNMGSNHARVISEHPDTELVYLIDPREQVGSAVAARYGATWLPSLPDLEGIDAVVVAAATEAHHPLALEVLGQDTALLVEKPVADGLAESEEILRLAESHDLVMMCGLLERFNPAVMTARAIMEDPVHVIATRHSPYAPRIRTGVSWDLLVHDVDLAIHLMGAEPNRVDAQLGFFHSDSAPQAEDVAEVLLGFENGGISRISASRIGQRKIRELQIYETGKLIEADLLRRTVTVYNHVAEQAENEGRNYRQQTVIEIPEIIHNVEPLTGQLTHFVSLLRGQADAAAERRSILPSHRVINAAIAQRTASHG